MGKKPAAKAQEIEKKVADTKEKAKEAKATAAAAETLEKKHHVGHASSKSREEQSCKIKKCKREYKAKGYCVAHYKQWRHGKFGVARYKTCGQMDCKKPMTVNRFGYCEDHFQAIYVKGTMTAEVTAPKEIKKEEAAA